ncbi:uncharacterized protein LOC107226435 isoform X1 [Neodiprion lecontei]|uniref:Uncharacterized protein LOC107226435 isoform X1 n=1 Tax=Neodiprion lecontei TaxID=441921 RepID=A0A6J0C849_NEOLC|nr:uncharacterized protein LOC107226435 isoform X1 [Neodiprion lecontei]
MNKDANEVGMRFPLRITKSNVTCSVRGCRTKASVHGTVRLHLFPKPNETFVDFPNEFGILEKTDRRRAWEKILKMEREASSWMRVCSLHFVKNDYCFQSVHSQRRHLKKTAVPSCNLQGSFLTGSRRGRKRNMKCKVDEEWLPKRMCRMQTEEQPKLVRIKEEPVDEDEGEQIDMEESLAVKTELLEPKVELDEPVNDIPSFTFVRTEVVTNDLRVFHFFDSDTSDAHLATLTGISKLSTLNNFRNTRHC